MMQDEDLKIKALSLADTSLSVEKREEIEREVLPRMAELGLTLEVDENGVLCVMPFTPAMFE